jgi:hypothetical protein
MANIAWIGGASNVAKEESVGLGGTWSASETITIDLDGAVSLTLTLGSASLNDIGNDVVYMMTGNGSLTSGSSVTGLGSAYGEFRQLSAVTYTTATTTLNFVGKVDGRPFTLNWSDTSGSGTTLQSVDIAAGSGAAWGTAANWEGGTAPSTGDTAIFDYRATSPLKFGINQAAVNLAEVDYRKDCKYPVGLPAINVDDPSYPYPEMLPTHLEIGTGTIAVNVGVNGEQAGTNSMSWVKVDTSTASTVNGLVYQTAVRSTQAPVNIITASTITSTWTVTGGDVEFGVGDGNSAEVDTLNLGSNATVTLGSGTYGTVNMSGGKVYALTSPTTVDGKGGGGTYYQRSESGSTNFTLKYTTLLIEGAAGTGTIAAYDRGIIDLRNDPRVKSLGAVDLYKGAGYADPLGIATLSAGLDLNGITTKDLRVWDPPCDVKVTFAATT